MASLLKKRPVSPFDPKDQAALANMVGRHGLPVFLATVANVVARLAVADSILEPEEVESHVVAARVIAALSGDEDALNL